MKHVLHSSQRPAGRTLALLLLGLPAVLGLADWLWAKKAGFAVAGGAYGGLALLTVALWAAGYFYETRRREPGLAAMLFGIAFLTGFTAAASILNAMLLTVAGPRIDGLLARADIALGLDWPGMMRRMADHPGLLRILQLVYDTLLFQVALAVIALGCVGRSHALYRFVLAVAVGALLCMFVWTLFPAFGAMSVYAFDPATIARLHVSVDGAYGQALVKMLHDGPGLIAPDSVKGLIGFPSYHAVLALLLSWYLGALPRLRWPLFILNGFVIFSTPIEGGHHWVDVFAAFPVALVSIAVAHRIVAWTQSMDHALAAQQQQETSAAAG